MSVSRVEIPPVVARPHKAAVGVGPFRLRESELETSSESGGAEEVTENRAGSLKVSLRLARLTELDIESSLAELADGRPKYVRGGGTGLRGQVIEVDLF